ncbi:MAG: GSCFA domain-containing protein, partial [bacterium]
MTESWKHASGFVYPVCPGTIRGEFDPDNHFFQNFSYAETRADLEETFAMVRAHRPGVRFLLTVSPVPLTASASADHVVAAV